MIPVLWRKKKTWVYYYGYAGNWNAYGAPRNFMTRFKHTF